jgi:hypothetical protein
MKIGLLPERIPGPAMLLRILPLRSEKIVHDLVTGKLMQLIIEEAEKLQLLQTGSIQRQILLVIEVIHRQVVLNIREQIIMPNDQRGHILFRQTLIDLRL